MSVGLEKDKNEEEDRQSTRFLFSQKEEDNYWKSGHVQGEVAKWNQESVSSQQAAEEAQRKKELLLAKMREIDCQNQGAQDSIFVESSSSESNKGTTDFSFPHPPDRRDRNSSIFNLTETEEMGSLQTGSREGGRRRPGLESGAVTGAKGRRGLRSQISSDDLAFGGYAPSFGQSVSRASSGFPPPPTEEDRNSALEAIGVFSIKGVEAEKNKNTEKTEGKDKKLSLMQQLFGAQALSTGDALSKSSEMELFSSPPPSNGVYSRRKGLLSFSSGSSTPPASSVNTLHVEDSRPTIRAITSFDDEIEELTL